MFLKATLILLAAIVMTGCVNSRQEVRPQAAIESSANESIQRWADSGNEDVTVGRLQNEYTRLLQKYIMASTTRTRDGGNPNLPHLYHMRWDLDRAERELTETINKKLE